MPKARTAAATIQRTRVSIDTQMSEAAVTLGLPFVRRVDPAGAVSYSVDSQDMTTREAAGYLLLGGFDEAFGRAVTIVNPDRLAS